MNNFNNKKKMYQESIENLEKITKKITEISLVMNIIFILSVFIMIISYLLNVFNNYTLAKYTLIIGFILTVIGLIFTMVYNKLKQIGSCIFEEFSVEMDWNPDEDILPIKSRIILKDYIKSTRLFILKSESIFSLILIILFIVDSVLFYEVYKSKEDNLPTISVVNTKQEIGQNDLTKITLDFREKSGIDVNFYTVSEDEDPLDSIIKKQAQAALNNDPTIFILDKEDLENHEDEFDVIDYVGENRKLSKYYIQKENDIIGIPFVLEGFGIVAKGNSKNHVGIDLKTFEGLINDENQFYMIKESWLYSSHLMSLLNIRNIDELDNKTEIVFDIFNMIISKDSLGYGIKYEESLRQFMNDNDARFCFTGTWSEPILMEYSDVNDLNIIPLPIGEKNQEIIIGPTKYIGISNKASDEEKENALKFLKWITEENVLNDIGLVCALNNFDLSDWSKDEYPLTYSMLEYFDSNNYNIYNSIDRETRKEIDKIIESILDNDKNSNNYEKVKESDIYTIKNIIKNYIQNNN